MCNLCMHISGKMDMITLTLPQTLDTPLLVAAINYIPLHNTLECMAKLLGVTSAQSNGSLTYKHSLLPQTERLTTRLLQ